MILSADPVNWLLAVLTASAWAAMSILTLRRARAVPAWQGGLLIGYASQSGTAETLARAGAAASGGRVLSLDRITAADLINATHAHFYIATTGDGDAPDNATAFLSRIMPTRPDLSRLSYAILAPGDRHYPQFCGFAHRVDGWLQDSGATPLFPLIEMDRDQPETLARWQQQAGLAQRGAGEVHPEPRTWQVKSRLHLNPGSPGGPLWHLVLQPQGMMPHWQAGDIATITIPTDSGPVTRDYSLASLPASGQAELILREVTTPEGLSGIGSHWLCRRLEVGDTLTLRIRPNPGFHSTDDRVPMLLIGNGSGLAGLMAHLRHRASRPAAGPVWLIHGERSPEHDAIFAAELASLQQTGALQRLDRSYSRAESGPRYVQHILRSEAAVVSAHIAGGGAIWICGRREGMASDVQTALEDILGIGEPTRLKQERRLRRDIY